VKFESTASDNLDADRLSPAELGMELGNGRVAFADGHLVEATLGDGPRTELWSVVYDSNDDGSIDFSDLAEFASLFRTEVATADSPLAWTLDFDKSGVVDFADLSALASNFRGSKFDGIDIAFPETFLQRWVGKTIEAVGDDPLDTLFDVANDAWADALGRDPVDVQLVVSDLPGTQLGEGRILSVDNLGQPDRGVVTVDVDAAGLVWYADTDAMIPAENYDLLTVLLHELGHVYGFTSSYEGFSSQLTVGQGDQWIFTTSDGMEIPLDLSASHLTEDAAPRDVMLPTLSPGVRKEITPTDVAVIQTAYDAGALGLASLTGDPSPMMAAREAVAQAHTISPPAAPMSTPVDSPATMSPTYEWLSAAINLPADAPMAPTVETNAVDVQTQGMLSPEIVRELASGGVGVNLRFVTAETTEVA
jgi:hypothetical protein